MRRNPDLIFRQGYEFIEATKFDPYFRVRLNFVSFQEGTDKLIRVIKYGFNRVNFAGNPTKPFLELIICFLFRLQASSWCPPLKRGEAFPRSVVFDNGVT
jgi:hypothetical protein